MIQQAGILQFEIQLGSAQANIETVRKGIREMEPTSGSIIVLPELWATGFDYPNAVEHAKETVGILAELQEIACRHDVVIAGSLIDADEDFSSLYNSLYVTGPDGVVGKFQKQHLFAHWKEDVYFQPGHKQYPLKTSSGVIGGFVCYDLRFPEIARNLAAQGAEILIVSAQWPAIRLDHWLVLLQARAIENQVFVVACNANGTTGGIAMGGHSVIIAPDGTLLAEAGGGAESLNIVLNDDIMRQARSKFVAAGEHPRPINDEGKVVSLEQLQKHLTVIKRLGGKVAFTNGCFDILHSGHVAYLEKARQSGDCLVLGLNSDVSVRSIKGNGRPINKEVDRARVLAALSCVDYVVLFEEDTPLNLIKTIMPHVLVKGADWPEDKIAGAAEVKTAGGKVVRIPFEHEVSTTDVIARAVRNSAA